MVALSARTGGSRHTGLAALPHENNQCFNKKARKNQEDFAILILSFYTASVSINELVCVISIRDKIAKL